MKSGAALLRVPIHGELQADHQLAWCRPPRDVADSTRQIEESGRAAEMECHADGLAEV